MSYGCDRRHVIKEEKFQAGFIVALVRPLYKEFAQIPGVNIDPALEQIEDNLAFWRRKIVRTVGKDAAQKAAGLKRAHNLRKFDQSVRACAVAYSCRCGEP